MSDLSVTANNGIFEVTLARGKANAIDAATSVEMGKVFAEFRDNPEHRVAIFSAAGERFFSAGWDLNAAADGEAFDTDYGVGGFGGYPELPNLNKPVLAAVNGHAIGGGFEIAMSADLVVAAEHAQFWLPESKVGIIPDAGTVRLPKLLPRALAMELLLTGRRMSAQEALERGLVNAVVAPETLLDKAREYAGLICEGAPLAIAAIKELVRGCEHLNLADSYALMRSGQVENYQAMLSSEDALEGPNAFAEKRSPVWRGR